MIESNKLMAKFLGCFQDDKGFWGFKDTPIYQRWHTDRFLDCTHYDTDWNWLMQVVEKIENLDNVVKIHLNSCFILSNESFANGKTFYKGKSHSETKIRAVYSACLQFIQNESNN